MKTPGLASAGASGTVLVTGATGRQGGAVARALLGRGFTVRALTRSPAGRAAQALAALGAELAQGDLDDGASLAAAVEGVDGVFSVQDPWAHGVVREIAQGKRLADVAKASGVGHFVYASVAYADQPTGVSHFESKGQIERHIAAIGLPATFIRPVFFMDLLLPSYDKARYIWGMLRRALGPDGRTQLTSARDIGRMVAEALSEPPPNAVRVCELASDELRYDELVACFREVRGEAPPSFSPPLWVVRFVDHEAASNFRWMGRAGWKLPLAQLRASYPWLTCFRDFLRAASD